MPYIARVLAVCWVLAANPSAFAIREFDIRTIESLGRKLYEKSKQDASSQSEREQRAIRSAQHALKGISLRDYRFVVLSDPDGSGFLVYGLATSVKPGEIVTGIHYRLTVSADGSRVEIVDALSRTHMVVTNKNLPKGYKTLAGFVLGQVVSNKPVETFVYLTLRHGLPCMIVTPDASVWWIEGGKITKDKKKATDSTPRSQ